MTKYQDARISTISLHPPRDRRWPRGWIAAVVAAGACAIGLLVVGVSPAKAACYEVAGAGGINYQCDIRGGGLGVGGGGGGGGQERAELGNEEFEQGGGGYSSGTGTEHIPIGVLNKVEELMSSTTTAAADCRSLLSPVTWPANQAPYDRNPVAVWTTARFERSSTQPPEHPGMTAEAPIGVGGSGTVTLYPRFYSQTPQEIFGYIPANNGLTRLPTEDEMKARTVLHEIAHLTGALGNHDQVGSNLFNLLILEKCFGINRIPV